MLLQAAGDPAQQRHRCGARLFAVAAGPDDVSIWGTPAALLGCAGFITWHFFKTSLPYETLLSAPAGSWRFCTTVTQGRSTARCYGCWTTR